MVMNHVSKSWDDPPKKAAEIPEPPQTRFILRDDVLVLHTLQTQPASNGAVALPKSTSDMNHEILVGS